MANPILNDKALKDASEAGYASGAWAPPQSRSTPISGIPMSNDPVSTWHSQTMTVQGTATATGVLFILLLASAALGWSQVSTGLNGDIKFPVWSLLGVIVGFVCVIVMRFKPQWSKVLGPIYALAEGFFIGAISHVYDSYKSGIVLQAVGATLAVFAVMLFLYRTQIIKVTERFKRIVIGATIGVMLFYGVALLINLFGGSVSFLQANNGSALGIGISLLVSALAAFNLALSFDFIERGAAAGLPKQMEWYAATGLMVTIVWLYLEILRLLAKLNSRR